jgi:hypothetical protein
LPGATSGTTIAGTGFSGSTATLLNTPKDVFVDSSQNIYVADSANNCIQYFLNGSATGITLSLSWPTTTGSLWGVQPVSGSIYACDKTLSAVWKNGSVVAGNLGAAGSAAINSIYRKVLLLIHQSPSVLFMPPIHNNIQLYNGQ